MKERIKDESESCFGEELLEEARRMSNKELREALWKARREVMRNLCEDFSPEICVNCPKRENCERSLIMEDIYSQELKKRELLEWALKTGGATS